MRKAGTVPHDAPAVRALWARAIAGDVKSLAQIRKLGLEMAPRSYSRRISRALQDELHDALDKILDGARYSLLFRVMRELGKKGSPHCAEMIRFEKRSLRRQPQLRRICSIAAPDARMRAAF